MKGPVSTSFTCCKTKPQKFFPQNLVYLQISLLSNHENFTQGVTHPGHAFTNGLSPTVDLQTANELFQITYKTYAYDPFLYKNLCM